MAVPIQSLQRSMKILAAMSKGGKPEYTIAELAEAVDLPASSVYRVLQTFALDHYVIADSKTHLYRLGPALIPLGQAAGAENDLKTVAMPFLQQIANETHDDAFLMKISGFHSQVIAKAEGPGRIKIVSSFEANFDLHCGANRKMLLAFQPDEYIEEYIRQGLPRHTPSTITDPEILWQEIRKIRKEQVSISVSEFIEGALGISAPVFDSTGQMIASIGTSGPAFQVTEEKINSHKQIITGCAAELSRALGYHKK